MADAPQYRQLLQELFDALERNGFTEQPSTFAVERALNAARAALSAPLSLNSSCICSPTSVPPHPNCPVHSTAPPLGGVRAPVPSWRCFHCDEVFTDKVAAAFHFGYAELETPACLVDAVELRNMELALRRYREEDTDLHRAIDAERLQGQQAAICAEEQGYARGLADAKKHPEELGLIAAEALKPNEQRATSAEQGTEQGSALSPVPDSST